VAEVCPEPQISQAQDYQWRDQLLTHAATAFEVHEQRRGEASLARENARLNTLVGELTLVLTKSEKVYCVEQRPVHKTRVLRLMREHQLLVTFNRRLPAKLTPTRTKPKPSKPHEWWGMYMTSDAIVRRYHIAPIDERQVRADIEISPVCLTRNGEWVHGAK
jgi:hypothetical protein